MGEVVGPDLLKHAVNVLRAYRGVGVAALGHEAAIGPGEHVRAAPVPAQFGQVAFKLVVRHSCRQ